VLVNLVDADNRVLASDHLRLTRIPAGATVYTGDQIHMALLPVARVEVVAVEAKSKAIEPSTPPLISDVLITPDCYGYVDTVYGQLLNRSPLQIQGGELGTVLTDVDGNIIGGARGIVQGPVSLGARELFQNPRPAECRSDGQRDRCARLDCPAVSAAARLNDDAETTVVGYRD